MANTESLSQIIQHVNDALAVANGLETEVIASAFKALKDDPNMTVAEALQVGIDEWVK